MTDFPVSQLAQWPGRFRSAQLVCAFATGQPVDLDLASTAILSGLIEDRDELQVFARLLETGEFEAARWMLNECPLFDDESTREQARQQMDLAQIDSKQMLAARIQELSDRADSAGLPIEASLEEELGKLCLTSRNSAEDRLTATEASLSDSMRTKIVTLRRRLTGAEDFDPAYVEQIEALIDAGHLRAAERLLDGTDTHQPPGPEGVRRLPSLAWKVPAKDVLRWHLEGRGGPPAFRPVRDERALELLKAYDALRQGGATNAQGFAQALDAFLHESGLASYGVTAHGEAFLIDLHHVFLDPQTASFSHRQRVRLVVTGPGVIGIPDDLADRSPYPFIAVGPSLARPELVGRHRSAILTLDDLLRLVWIKNRRPVALLRIIGRQWPTRALAGETSEELDRLLGSDDQERWLRLSWLVDLCGLGDTTVADAIAFETGLDAALIQTFFDYLDRQQAPGPPDSSAMRDVTRDWHTDRRMSASVEGAVRAGLRNGLDTAVAFWAALTVASPGQQVSMLELAIAAESAAPARRETDGDDQISWDKEVAVGAAELAKLWLVSSQGENADRVITLKECGAYGRLALNAPQRLKEACENRAEQLRHANRESRRGLARIVHAQHQHALRRLRVEFENVANDPESPQHLVAAKRKALDAELARVLDGAGMNGPCELGAVLRSMSDGFHEAYQTVSVILDGATEVTVAVGRVLVWAMLEELLANAAQVLVESGGGEIEVDVEPAEDEVLIHIRDSGEGIRPDVRHKIFRDGVSTRGSNRGFGLYNARRIADGVENGSLELAEPTSSDPKFPGAHFLLSLPRH